MGAPAQHAAFAFALAIALSACRFDPTGSGESGASVGDESTSSTTGSTTAAPGDTSSPDGTSTGSLPDATSSSSTGGPPSSWWDPAWAKRKRIALELPGGVEAPLFAVPVLVRLDSMRIPYAELLERGRDLRFVDGDDELELAHEIERWDPDGSSFVWVSVPALGDVPDDAIFMYWGNPQAEASADPHALWAPDVAAVWHLDDDPEAAPPQVHDSSAAARHGTLGGGMDVNDWVAGWTARALEFDGVDDTVTIGAIDTDAWTAITMSAWLRHASSDDERALSKATGIAGQDHVFLLGAAGDGAKVRVHTDGAGGGSAELVPAETVPLDTWTHVAATWSADAGEVVLYIDGEPIATAELAGATLFDQSSDVLLANATADADRRWEGIIDEVRLETVARTSGWMRTQYASMTDALATFGEEELAP